MESILIFGNGITKDTYGGEFQTIKRINEKITFFIDYIRNKESQLFSKEFYPDLFNDVEVKENSNINTIAEFYLNEIKRIENEKNKFFPIEYWQNVVLFNSFCDYIYKLFWYYHRNSNEVDTTNNGINLFSKSIYEKNKKPVIINLNYDLVVEKHLEINKIPIVYHGFNEGKDNAIKIYKPHGSINFLSNSNNPNDHGFVNDEPFYPFTNNSIIKEKNPIRFRCQSIGSDNKLGKIIVKEKPMYAVEIVPPGCSNLIKESTVIDFLIPWAKEIHYSIFNELSNKKNIILIGLSFWDADCWELVKYIKKFITKNKAGRVYILKYKKNNNRISNLLQKNSIDLDRVEFLYGSFTENYHQILNLL